jgi:hypothetical protein
MFDIEVRLKPRAENSLIAACVDHGPLRVVGLGDHHISLTHLLECVSVRT